MLVNQSDRDTAGSKMDRESASDVRCANPRLSADHRDYRNLARGEKPPQTSSLIVASLKHDQLPVRLARLGPLPVEAPLRPPHSETANHPVLT